MKRKVDEKQNSASVGLLKDKPELSRWHCLSTYIPFDTVKRYLQYCPFVKHWSIILHDKDVLENGEVKQPHTHILLYTYDAKSSSAVLKRFENLAKQYALENGGEVQNTFGQLCYEPLAMYRYQLHLDDYDKHQYDTFERITDDDCYWSDFERANGKSENKAVEIFDALCEGASTRDMLVRFGCEYSHNADKYKQLVRCYRSEKELEEHHLNKCQDDKNFEELLRLMCGRQLENSPFAEQSKKENFYNILAYCQSVLRNECACELDFASV